MSKSILVVEDEALIAMQIETDLQEAGYRVIGPCLSLSACHETIAAQDIDAAVLNVDIAGYDVFPVASALQERGIAFVFHTGRGRSPKIRRLFPDVPVCTKPAEAPALLRKLDLPRVAP